MNKKSPLYERRVKALEKVIKEKTHVSEKININLSTDDTLNKIKETMINNNILKDHEINDKVFSIKESLKSLLEIKNSEGSFFKYKKENFKNIRRIEGHPISHGISLNILFKSDDLLISEVKRKKNSKEPFHQNHDHTTVSILNKGKLRIIIDEDEYIAEKGDIWIYKPNIYHTTEALIDSSELSIKFPPIMTW